MIHPDVRAVFFDVVGTLLVPDRPVSQTYVEVACRYGADADEGWVRMAFRAALARQDEIDRLAGWRTDEARERSRWQAIVREVLPVGNAPGCFDELWAWYARPAAWSLNPEAAEIIGQLTDHGLFVGVASNFDSRLKSVLGGFRELGALRSRCVISSLVGWRKPAPEFFAELVRVAGRRPDEILHVGDDLQNDILGATAVGLQSVLFDPEGKSSATPRIRQLRNLLPG
jgi:putative hydrolase of the HAD superfamily